ncbi:hypothetical protein OKW21_000607 [Catalinimonas alkaloidigena]|uniref:hypothetical protein n=1 Tax=Catalinimonas alkaloidigena TaxID=1075417 RepID=UPI002406125F|nr:hypothetical protein [Catalinimonas alkaloidigena]MDF9795344.1 hypothetical protein [Catalinimonas alkaloidigena]
MIPFLGELSLQSRDTSDLFYQHQVEAAFITYEVEGDQLIDTPHINGFDADTELDYPLVESLPDLEMIPVELEAGNQEVKIMYRDAEQFGSQYEVIVYLLIEEE